MKKLKLSILDISLTSGGAEKVISLFLKKLVDDYEVTLILFYNEIHFEIPPQVEVIIFKDKPPKMGSPFTKLGDLWVFARKYRKVIKERKIDCAISFLAWPNFINGILALTTSRVTTIISERGFPSDNVTSRASYWIAKIFYPLLYNRCDKLFSNSVFINKDLRENFGVKLPMEVIYNPIEIPRESSDDERTNSEKAQLITVGSLIPRKNQLMILKALREVTFPFHFNILGEGPLRSQLETYVKNGEMDQQVSLVGKTTGVYDYLLRSDIFILSSHTEGFPNALLEGMSAGLACVSTNCLSGPLELLNDGEHIEIPEGEFVAAKYGLLVNNDDHLGMHKALDFLVSNPEQMRSYRKLSAQRAQDFELGTVYKQLKEFINSEA